MLLKFAIILCEVTMKVKNDDSTAKTLKKSNKEKVTDDLPKKKSISDSKIRKKLEEHTQVGRGVEKAKLENSAKLGEGFLKDKSDEKPNIEGNSLVKSDVGSNKASDSNTSEKLKTILSSGAFGFNPKERENLERILGKN